VIVDASVVVASLGDVRTARHLRRAELLAPDLLIPETLNALWKVARLGRPVPERSIVLDLLDRIRIVPSRPHAARAAEIAEEIDHPVYDCLYLAVAETEGDVLVTIDARLGTKVAKTSLRRRLRLLPAPSFS
jgi:predicted nucleic acid-binding protein